MGDFLDVLRALVFAHARFVVVGGVALQLQGCGYITEDVDLVYERTRENARVVAAALSPFKPRPREFPADVPFVFDAQTLMSSEILTLTTTAGDIDLLCTIKGFTTYGAVEAASETIAFDDLHLRVLSVEGLIMAKRAAGRPKDEPGLIELEALREARAIAKDRQ
jgi:predicted nucleotidyltransferase